MYENSQQEQTQVISESFLSLSLILHHSTQLAVHHDRLVEDVLFGVNVLYGVESVDVLCGVNV